VENNNYKSITPLQQLLMVLPVQSSYLLPQSYQQLMFKELKDLYPKDYELDFLFHKKFWQTLPILPIINPFKIIKYTKNIKLNDDEYQRNTFKDNFQILV
jgi:5'-3' exoribonuclease 2